MSYCFIYCDKFPFVLDSIQFLCHKANNHRYLMLDGPFYQVCKFNEKMLLTPFFTANPFMNCLMVFTAGEVNHIHSWKDTPLDLLGSLGHTTINGTCIGAYACTSDNSGTDNSGAGSVNSGM